MIMTTRTRGPGRRALLAAGAATMLARPALAQAGFPDRPIRLLIPWPPGASADAFLRAIADQAGKRLGQTILPENRPGASGSLGAAALRTSGPTATCWRSCTPASTGPRWPPSGRPMTRSTDFTYIIQLSGSVHGIVVRADAPWRSLQDLLDAARANPGRITYGTLGPTSVQHMAMLEIVQRTGTEMTHVPYRGGGERYTGLLGRQIDVVADASGWAAMVQDGQFRALVVWGGQRMGRFPDVPTLRDAGIDMVVNSPYGVGGPKGMDPAVVAKLHEAMKEALFDPVTQAVMERFNMPTLYLDSAGFDAAARRQVEIERENLRRAGMLPAGR